MKDPSLLGCCCIMECLLLYFSSVLIALVMLRLLISKLVSQFVLVQLGDAMMILYAAANIMNVLFIHLYKDSWL